MSVSLPGVCWATDCIVPDRCPVCWPDCKPEGPLFSAEFVCLSVCLSVCVWLWPAILPFSVDRFWRSLVTSSLAATIMVQIGRRGTARRLFENLKKFSKITDQDETRHTGTQLVNQHQSLCTQPWLHLWRTVTFRGLLTFGRHISLSWVSIGSMSGLSSQVLAHGVMRSDISPAFKKMFDLRPEEVQFWRRMLIGWIVSFVRVFPDFDWWA